MVSISSGVLYSSIVILIEFRASSGLRPIAVSTWLGSESEALHAEPAETQIPLASSSIRRLMFPGLLKEKFTFPGSLLSGWPFSTAPGRFLSYETSLSLIPVTSRIFDSISSTDSLRAAVSPAIPGRFSVPARIPIS